jgi:hypothetical protein
MMNVDRLPQSYSKDSPNYAFYSLIAKGLWSKYQEVPLKDAILQIVQEEGRPDLILDGDYLLGH